MKNILNERYHWCLGNMIRYSGETDLLLYFITGVIIVFTCVLPVIILILLLKTEHYIWFGIVFIPCCLVFSVLCCAIGYFFRQLNPER
jgi:hypothetical protein